MQDGSYTRYTSPSDRARRRRRKRQARRRLLLLVLVVLVAVLAAAVLVVRGRGGEGPADAARSGGDSAATAPGATPTPTPAVWVAGEADPVRVWVGGDSMGGELGWSLEPVLEGSRVFKPITYYKESSGICRYDFFDWQKKMKTVSKGAKPDAVVIMVGTNDTQSVWTDGGWIPYGNAEWKRAYGDRVGDIIDTLLDGGARRVYWVGMPIMGEGWRNSRMRFINGIFRQQAEKRPGAEYVDIWDLYTTSDGSFDPALRLADKVHFTVEGQELLADEVYRAIKADWLPPGSETPGASPSPSPSPSAPGS